MLTINGIGWKMNHAAILHASSFFNGKYSHLLKCNVKNVKSFFSLDRKKNVISVSTLHVQRNKFAYFYTKISDCIVFIYSIFIYLFTRNYRCWCNRTENYYTMNGFHWMFLFREKLFELKSHWILRRVGIPQYLAKK